MAESHHLGEPQSSSFGCLPIKGIQMIPMHLQIRDFSNAEDVFSAEFLPTDVAGARSLFDIMQNVAENLRRERFFCASAGDIVAHLPAAPAS